MNEFYKDLINCECYKNWLINHKKSYLSHFFSAINSKLEKKTNWEVGFFNPDNQKITIFIKTEDGFIIKQEDEVFKKETTVVEKLNLENVKIEFEEAAKKYLGKVGEFFPKEILGDGFVVLQNFENKTQWNFTLVSKSLKFANFKINSLTGEVDSHQLIEAVQRDK